MLARTVRFNYMPVTFSSFRDVRRVVRSNGGNFLIGPFSVSGCTSGMLHLTSGFGISCIVGIVGSVRHLVPRGIMGL